MASITLSDLIAEGAEPATNAAKKKTITLSELQADSPEAIVSAGRSAGDMLSQIPRQLGLTARAGLTGLGDTLGILSNPIASLLNLGTIAAGRQAQIPNARDTLSGIADRIGLPSPETPTERVAQDTAGLLAGGGIMGAAGRAAALAPALGSKIPDAIRSAGEVLSANLGTQAASAVGAGLLGGGVREGGGTPGAQFAGSVAGALLGGMAPGAVRRMGDAARRWIAPAQTVQQIDVRIERMLADQGVDYAALPQAAKNALRSELSTALAASEELRPDAVRRLADYATVGATPTRGTITLDPVQITREKNLAKMAANSGMEELHGLPRMQNENNRVLIDSLNRVRGENPADAFAAGQNVIGTISGKDARFSKIENRLYERARDSAGRQIPLDREAFVLGAYQRLGESNKGAFLPSEIGTLLEQIRTGSMKAGGRSIEVPFSVDVIDNLKTVLASASRSTRDGNARAAIRDVRDALENTPISAEGMGAAGPGLATAAQGAAMASADALPAEALRAFDRARAMARARRSWQESSPAIKASLDDAPPDTFVQKYVLSAPVFDVAKVAQELKRAPEAIESVRSAIIGHLKDKALYGAADEVGKFSASGYNRAFNAIEKKLPLFFNGEEIAGLKAAGRVASYEMAQPVGSAVNNSNTGALLGGRGLDLASALANKIPFGRAAVTDPLKSIMLSVGTRSAQNLTPGLLAPQFARPMNERLLPFALTGGLLSAQVSQ